MTFYYEELTSRLARPTIPILLKSGNKIVFYVGLIDSGADYCVFSIETAKALGIKLSRQIVKIEGVGSSKVKGRFGTVTLKIGSASYKLKAVFAEIRELGYGILGGIGFFDHFDVKLSYKKRTIEINHSSRIS